MIKEHRIESILDLLALSEDELQRMLPDLALWHQMGRELASQGAAMASFIWVDDGKPAQVHSIRLVGPDGAVTVVQGAAYSERTTP